jgi:predicted DNA-binding protein
MKQAVSFRLSQEAKRLLKNLAEQNGISQASVLEMLIRKESKKQK